MTGTVVIAFTGEKTGVEPAPAARPPARSAIQIPLAFTVPVGLWEPRNRRLPGRPVAMNQRNTGGRRHGDCR
jgi:hypothetical protein